jgi:hypothetical protein
MAAQTTALTEVTTNGNKRTYSYAAHTLTKPALVITTQKIPSGNESVAEFMFSVVRATEDSAGDVLPSKIYIEGRVRRPLAGIQADFDAALVIARDIFAGDEFANSADTIEPLV